MILIYLGIDVKFSSTNIGSQEGTEVGNHISPIKTVKGDGIINNFKDSTFTEYLVEVDRNKYITDGDESLFSFGEIMQTIKKEIVYVER